MNQHSQFQYFTEADSVEAVNDRVASDTDERLAAVMHGLVKQFLIADFEPVDHGETKWRSSFDFVLHRSA